MVEAQTGKNNYYYIWFQFLLAHFSFMMTHVKRFYSPALFLKNNVILMFVFFFSPRNYDILFFHKFNVNFLFVFNVSPLLRHFFFCWWNREWWRGYFFRVWKQTCSWKFLHFHALSSYQNIVLIFMNYASRYFTYVSFFLYWVVPRLHIRKCEKS